MKGIDKNIKTLIFNISKAQNGSRPYQIFFTKLFTDYKYKGFFFIRQSKRSGIIDMRNGYKLHVIFNVKDSHVIRPYDYNEINVTKIDVQDFMFEKWEQINEIEQHILDAINIQQTVYYIDKEMNVKFKDRKSIFGNFDEIVKRMSFDKTVYLSETSAKDNVLSAMRQKHSNMVKNIQQRRIDHEKMIQEMMDESDALMFKIRAKEAIM